MRNVPGQNNNAVRAVVLRWHDNAIKPFLENLDLHFFLLLRIGHHDKGVEVENVFVAPCAINNARIYFNLQYKERRYATWHRRVPRQLTRILIDARQVDEHVAWSLEGHTESVSGAFCAEYSTRLRHF